MTAKKLMLIYKATQFLEAPSVQISDVVGLEGIKEVLRKDVALPLRSGDACAQNILLHGLPGTGKSMMVHAIANEVADVAKYFWLHACDCVSRYFLDEMMPVIFEMAEKSEPSLVFVDEIDLFMSDDSTTARKKKDLVDAIQQIQSQHVVVVAATSKPWVLDEQLQSQFPKKVHVPLLNESERADMIKSSLKGLKHELDDNDFKDFAKITDGYTTSDIIIVMRDASMYPVRRIANSTHFKIIQSDNETEYAPCDATDESSFKSSMLELPDVNKIRIDPIQKSDVCNAISKYHQDNSQELEKHLNFTENQAN